MVRKILFVLLAWLFLCGASLAQERIVLASLEWPPYTGSRLVDDGASAEVVRAAFRAMGYALEIRFFPWNRTLDEARNNPEVMGYFPEYYSSERARDFLFSDSIGKSPLGLARRSSRSVRWHSLSDLSKYSIGTVQGYVNTEKFDQMVATGVLRVDTSVSDVLNLRKVLAGRVDMAVVDANVYTYLMNSDGQLHAQRSELRLDHKLLTIHDLYVCFRRDGEGGRLLKIFNEGLKRIRVQLIQRHYMENIGIR